MSQLARAVAAPVIDPSCLHRLETHFIAPDIYRRDDVAMRQARLARIVSGNIIPRMLRLHAEVATASAPVESFIDAIAPNGADVDKLAHVVLGPDLAAAAAYVTVLRDRGLSMETLCLELLEPTARALGEMWNRDECDFIDVTLAVARLQKLLAIFNDTHKVPALDTRRHVLMAMTPGNQHDFGVKMVEKFLSSAGWQVETDLSGNIDEIVDTAARKYFAVVGLTAGSDQQLASLKATIVELRARSKNATVGIMVGGPMFATDPALVAEVGADATAPNAAAAVVVAQKLFDLVAVKELAKEPA